MIIPIEYSIKFNTDEGIKEYKDLSSRKTLSVIKKYNLNIGYMFHNVIEAYSYTILTEKESYEFVIFFKVEDSLINGHKFEISARIKVKTEKVEDKNINDYRRNAPKHLLKKQLKKEVTNIFGNYDKLSLSNTLDLPHWNQYVAY
jgi:hypothetical protein